jgi:superfamily II DNA or RNA helicase
MPKAILSNRIYLDVDKELADRLTKELTYKIRKNIPGATHFTQFDIIKNYKVVKSGIMSIPIGRLDLIPEHYEIVDKRILYEVPFPDPKFELLPGQQLIFDEVDDSCFINALVGWGKTFTALHIARKLGQKTLIITHNTMLRTQWEEEVWKLFGMPVGVIGSGQLDYEDNVITVANIQTLSKKDVLLKVQKDFGTIILDEAHHCPASTFTNAIDSMHAKYRIALSGTMTRKDGRHILFKDFFGPKLYQPPQDNTLTPTIKIIKTGRVLKPGGTWVEKVNDLLYDPDYQEFVARMAQVQIHNGHSVLIVGDRVEFLQNVGEIIGNSCVCITGATTEEDRKEFKRQLEEGEKDCVAGSRQIISEGWSVNRLSCVILATPISNDALLEQIIGRVQRMHPEKLNPEVLDLNFAGSADRKQNRDRLSFYMRKGWEVQGI